MKRYFVMVLWALLWAAGFIAASIIVIAADMLLRHHHGRPSRDFAAAVVTLFTFIYLSLLCFSRLPGARSRPGTALILGPVQGIWAVVVFLVMQVNGAFILVSVVYGEQAVLTARHSLLKTNMNANGMLCLFVVAGELAAALWVVWLLRRLGVARLTDGSAAGIAWCAAAGRGYLTAAGMAVGILLMVAGITHLFPPDMNALKDAPFTQLSNGPLWTAPLLGVLIVFLGPAIEEVLFRGVMFAGLASRFGAVWAVLGTAAVFVAVHAPEKIYYPPGFIDVGLAALANGWLRLRFYSIKPGILLHVLYNGGSMVVLGLLTK